MNEQMLLIQQEFLKNSNVGFASISITPKIDTQEILKNYAISNGITHENWHLLSGKSEETVFNLSNNGFKLYAGIDENIEHGGPKGQEPTRFDTWEGNGREIDF